MTCQKSFLCYNNQSQRSDIMNFNSEFELNKYLDSIQYDEAQIQREREDAIQKILKDNRDFHHYIHS